MILKKCWTLFPFRDANIIEKKWITSVRTAENGAYAIWIKYDTKPDEELRGLSANALRKRKIPCITLEEQLLFVMKYFEETGKLLNGGDITLCAGSSYSDNFVLNVGFFDGKVDVDINGQDEIYGSLRARQVVI